MLRALLFLLLAGPAFAGPVCQPAQLGGTGTVAVQGKDSKGYIWRWWCKRSSGVGTGVPMPITATTGLNKRCTVRPGANGSLPASASCKVSE